MPAAIGIDCRFASTPSGLGRYARELVTHLLARRDPLLYVLFVRDPGEEWLKRLPSSPTNYKLQMTSFPHYSFSEQLFFPGMLRTSGIDLLLSPHFNVPWRCPIPFVITVHDLILHHFPNRASMLRQMAYRFLMAHAVSLAQSIITVSAFTARELERIYGDDVRAKTVVIPEGISASFRRADDRARERVRRQYGLKEHFYLYVGNCKQHKNVPMLIEAFLALRDPRVELVLAVSGPEARSLRPKEGIRILRNVPDADLPALYSAARACVTASLYEGFCLPVIEAEACGCPVIATRCGAIPEVASPGAILVEPDVESLARGMTSVLHASRSRKIWDWGVTAEKTAEVLLHCTKFPTLPR